MNEQPENRELIYFGVVAVLKNRCSSLLLKDETKELALFKKYGDARKYAVSRPMKCAVIVVTMQLQYSSARAFTIQEQNLFFNETQPV